MHLQVELLLRGKLMPSAEGVKASLLSVSEVPLPGKGSQEAESSSGCFFPGWLQGMQRPTSFVWWGWDTSHLAGVLEEKVPGVIWRGRDFPLCFSFLPPSLQWCSKKWEVVENRLLVIYNSSTCFFLCHVTQIFQYFLASFPKNLGMRLINMERWWCSFRKQRYLIALMS